MTGEQPLEVTHHHMCTHVIPGIIAQPPDSKLKFGVLPNHQQTAPKRTDYQFILQEPLLSAPAFWPHVIISDDVSRLAAASRLRGGGAILLILRFASRSLAACGPFSAPQLRRCGGSCEWRRQQAPWARSKEQKRSERETLELLSSSAHYGCRGLSSAEGGVLD